MSLILYFIFIQYIPAYPIALIQISQRQRDDHDIRGKIYGGCCEYAKVSL